MIQIITDTSANLPEEMLRELSISVVPFHYTVDGVEYPSAQSNNKLFEGAPFYDALRKGAVAHTSMVNTHAFCEAFEPLLSEGTDIIYIGMSSGISGAYQASVSAADDMRKRFPERKIAVIDTRAASLGEGLPVLHAARMNRDGFEFDEIVSSTQHNSAFICQYFTVEDLVYLKRGGRISSAAAFVGNVLQIKPILMGDHDGKIVIHHKERGRRKALVALVQRYEELVADKKAPVGIAHADSEEDANYIAQRIRESGHTGELIVTCYEPVTGAHVGPGTIAIFFYGIHR